MKYELIKLIFNKLFPKKETVRIKKFDEIAALEDEISKSNIDYRLLSDRMSLLSTHYNHSLENNKYLYALRQYHRSKIRTLGGLCLILVIFLLILILK